MSLATPDASTVVTVELALKEHAGVGDTVTALHAVLAVEAEALAREAPNLSREGLAKSARDRVDRNIAPKFQLLQESAHAALAAVDRQIEALMTPRFPEGSEAAIRVAQVMWFRDLSMPQKLAAAQADASLAAAVVEAGPALSGVPVDVWERQRREMAVTQRAAQLVKRPEFRTQPSADDPIAGTPDLEAARREAEREIKALEDEREVLDRIAPLLGSVVNAVALMTAETRAEAFTRLTA
jgi:hypothetical protein